MGILKDKKVAVLMGGPGAEREVSLRSGAAVGRALEACGAMVRTRGCKGTDFAWPRMTRPRLQHDPRHLRRRRSNPGNPGSARHGLHRRGRGTAAGLPLTRFSTKRKFDAAGVPTSKWEIVNKGRLPRWPCLLSSRLPARDPASVCTSSRTPRRFRPPWRIVSSSATRCWSKSFSRARIDGWHSGAGSAAHRGDRAERGVLRLRHTSTPRALRIITCRPISAKRPPARCRRRLWPPTNRWTWRFMPEWTC